MGYVTDKGADVYRDFKTAGVPASGANEPAKFEIRSLFSFLDGALAQLLAGFVADQAVVVYAARSSLYANLTPADRTLGLVYNDGPNNGLYIKNGASGSGSWGSTGLMLQGQQGDAATVQIGSVTSGSVASVTNSGSSSAAVFNFVLQPGKSFLQTAIDSGYVPAGTTEAQLIAKITSDIVTAATAQANAASDQAVAAATTAGTARDQSIAASNASAASAASADEDADNAKLSFDGVMAAVAGQTIAVPIYILATRGILKGTNVPPMVQQVDIAGFRTVGLGAHTVYRWGPPLANLPASGQNYWWDQSADGAQWFIPPDRGSPEMLGAYADDGVNLPTSATFGTDDGVYIQKAVEYFKRVDLPGKYYSTITINVARTITVRGIGGVGASSGYQTRVRFARGCVGFFFHRTNTYASNKGVPTFGTNGFGGADGYSFGGMMIVMGQGDYIPYDGSNITHHSVWTKCRGLIFGLDIRGTMGNGVYCYASTSNTDPYLSGNANDLVIEFVRGSSISGSLIYLDGPDANAGRIRGINCGSCGGPAVYASEFLGNAYDTPQAASAGRAGTVNYGGFIWWCANASLGGTDVPGATPTWIKGLATALPDSWVSGKAYLLGFNYFFDDDNARMVITNPYTENGGPVYAGLNTLILGGLMQGALPAGWYGLGGRLTGTELIFGMSYLGTPQGRYSKTAWQVTFGATDYEFARVANVASAGNRNTYQTYCSGYLPDGLTPRPIASAGVLSGNAAHRFRIGLYDLTGATKTEVLGITLTDVRPEVDNAISLGLSTNRWSNAFAAQFRPGTGAAIWTTVAGSPEGALAAPVGSLATQGDGAAGSQVWSKASGTGNTGWQRLAQYISGSAVYDAPSIAAASAVTTTVTVTGAALGDVCEVSFSIAMGGLMKSAEVSAANTVRVTLFNPTAAPIDLASATVKAVVWKAG